MRRQHPYIGVTAQELLNLRIPVGECGKPGEGPPLGKVTIDATPDLKRRLDNLVTSTTRLADEATVRAQAAGALLAAGMVTLAVAYVARAFVDRGRR